MHDCRTMESRLVDLVFGELGAEDKLRLLAEVEACADCLDEYRSMTGTLLVFDQAIEASLPDESYWPEHQSLRDKHLEEITPRALIQPTRAPLWKRFFVARLPVPVPVAVALLLALLGSSVLALRPSQKETITTVRQPPVVTPAPPPPQIIEVPVIREKVVTRIVYVEKKEREKNETGRKTTTARVSEPTLTARQTEAASVQGGFFTRANLTDFQPTDEMKIRVIKRSNSDEN
jgi:hypothetical protein